MNKRKIPALSPAERQVMRVLWESERPLRASEITERLESITHWQLNTVRTFLTRLEKKGILRTTLPENQTSGVNLYEPILAEADLRVEVGRSFLDEYFGGTLCGLMSSFIERGEVSDEELREIREMIERTMKK